MMEPRLPHLFLRFFFFRGPGVLLFDFFFFSRGGPIFVHSWFLFLFGSSFLILL